MKKELLVLTLALAACSPSEDDLIGAAQLCVDKASPSEAYSCIEPIRHINKRSANIVKCSAGFAAEGFGKGQKLVAANRELDDPAKGSPSFLGLMTFASKTTPDQNRQFAKEVDAYCQGTGKPVYDLLSAMSLSATTISAVGGLNWDKNSPPNRDDIRSAISNMLATRSDPQTAEGVREIGRLVLRMVVSGCQTDRDIAPRLCERVESALNADPGNKDADTVGDRALEAWRQ
ncbi:hypothetical protein [Bdellovibrio sp. HCB337]|uniref:hypothetical protein n=1 Tax=Bdellovibrio sp. HCB337 TaxID=3394358 RepID=UPI0039A65382